jgi:hypothetical protein
MSASGNDLTVNANLASVQQALTISGNDTSTYKLINGTTVRDLKATQNASITLSGNDLTISGPDLSGYQLQLTASGDDATGYKLLAGNTLRNLKAGNYITLSASGADLTIAVSEPCKLCTHIKLARMPASSGP